ncbi:MAG TPA: FliM/FliN family flagellar motor switch protein, partial [Paraburkholderia sp.]
MNPWRDLERISLEHARRHNVAALYFGTAWPVKVGNQGFTLQFEPCRRGYPLRLLGRAAGAPLTLDCDAQALFPELAGQTLTQAGTTAHLLISQAFEDWLCALEGLFGFALDLSGTSFDVSPNPGAYGLALTHDRTHRTAHFALDSEAVDQWMSRQTLPVGQTDELSRRLSVPVSVCLAGPALTLPRLRRIRPSDALLLDGSSPYLRLPLHHGARRILLKSSGEYMVIDRPMIDAAAEAAEAADMTSELVPTSALSFSFEAVIGTLSLTLDELTRLRSGSIVSLQLPAHRSAVMLLCQGVPFARGELIDIDDALGVRIVDLAHATPT